MAQSIDEWKFNELDKCLKELHKIVYGEDVMIKHGIYFNLSALDVNDYRVSLEYGFVPLKKGEK